MMNENYGLIGFGEAGMEPLHKAQNFEEFPIQGKEKSLAYWSGRQ